MSKATNKKTTPTLATAVNMASKATTKPAAKKPAKPAARPAAKVKTVKAYATQDKAAPYSVMHNQTAKSAYTAAALIVSGFMKLGKTGNPLKAGKGNTALFRALVGTSAYSYWKRGQLIEADEVTKAGVNKVGARLDNTAPTYRTELQAIKDMVEAMQRKGQIEIGGEKITISREVEASA